MNTTQIRVAAILIWLAAGSAWAQEPDYQERGYAELHEQIEHLTKKVEALYVPGDLSGVGPSATGSSAIDALCPPRPGLRSRPTRV